MNSTSTALASRGLGVYLGPRPELYDQANSSPSLLFPLSRNTNCHEAAVIQTKSLSFIESARAL